MHISFLLCSVLTLLQLYPLQLQQVSQEETVLINIVFMRTEGLLMTQLLEQKSKNKNIVAICKRAKNYYVHTQPILVEVIKGKALPLDQYQFEEISKEAEKRFENYNDKNESEWIRMYQDHIQNSLRTYSLLLQGREWSSVTYFSFQALPELINIDQELKKIKFK